MKINHDRSFLEHGADEFVFRGLAENRPHSIHIRFVYTEAQRAENARNAKILPEAEWNTRCDTEAKRRSEYIRPVMEAIAERFGCYQYNEKRFFAYCSGDWDLFFWCNDFHSITNGAVTGRNLAHISLSFNSRHDTSHRDEILRDLMRLLVDDFSSMENLSVTIQYETHFFNDKIFEIAKANRSKLDGRKCNYLGVSGRLVKNGEYIYFMKKRARTRGHLLSEREQVAMLWQLET